MCTNPNDVFHHPKNVLSDCLKRLDFPQKIFAHVEMMGLIGAGNNPMVGMTVACAVAASQANA